MIEQAVVNTLLLHYFHCKQKAGETIWKTALNHLMGRATDHNTAIHWLAHWLLMGLLFKYEKSPRYKFCIESNSEHFLSLQKIPADCCIRKTFKSYIFQNLTKWQHFVTYGRSLHVTMFGTVRKDLGAVAPPKPLLTVPNIMVHQSMASVPTSYYLTWHYSYLCTLKG